MGSFSDYFGVYTYRPPLIYFKVENFDSWMHREMAAKKDYFLKKFINGLDVAIFQENPVFVPDILHSETEENTPNKPVGQEIEVQLKPFGNGDTLEDWNRENWKDLCIRLWDSARTHKWCVVQLYNKYPWWRVFTYREVFKIDYNENDVPIKVYCKWTKTLPVAQTWNYHEEEINLVEVNANELNKDGNVNSLGIFINWGHDIDEKSSGNDLEDVWSLSIYLRYIMNDILANSAKSSGFYWITYGDGVADEIKDDIVNAFELCSSSHMVGADEQTIKRMEAMYPKNPEFSILAMDKVMKVFSGATGLPYLFYNGEKDTSGVFEENSSALAQINDKKREVFGQLKRYLLKLVEMRWGIICEDVFPNISEVEGESFEEDVMDKGGSSSDDGISKELKRGRLQA